MKIKIIKTLESVDPHLKHLYYFNHYSQHLFGEHEKKEQMIDPELHKKLHDELIWTKKVSIILLGDIFNDPYQRCEKDLKMTQKCLDIIAMHKFPLHIITRSELITKDLDLLKKIQNNSWIHVSISIFTMDKKLAKILEPDSPEPEKRVMIAKKLSQEGISAGILYTFLPYISDSKEELELLFQLCEKNNIKVIVDEPLHITEESKTELFRFMNETPRLKKYLNRYERCYKDSETPQLKFIKEANKIMFDLSMKYNIHRNVPEFKGEQQKQLE
jgi:DNA repair photolyase